MGSVSHSGSTRLRRQQPLGPRQDDDDDALVAQLGSEVAAALSSALERVNALTATGRIDRAGLRALRDEVDRARRVGMMGQQVTRMVSGRLRLSPERLDLTALLLQALQQRGLEMESRGIEVRQTLRPAVVTGDATLTFSLLQSLLDWSFEHACSRIDIAIDHQNWPPQARLCCSFAYQPADEVVSAAMPLESQALGTIAWRLLERTAATLGLAITREDGRGSTTATIGFPHTVVEPMEGVSAVELDGGSTSDAETPALAGNHLLVLSARREVRNLVRQALRPMGMMIDFVTSVDEAREFCSGGLPHVVVHEEALGGAEFESLRRDLLIEAPRLGFIEISEDSRAFEVRRVGEREIARVGRAAIIESLPAALRFELGRSL